MEPVGLAPPPEHVAVSGGQLDLDRLAAPPGSQRQGPGATEAHAGDERVVQVAHLPVPVEPDPVAPVAVAHQGRRAEVDAVAILQDPPGPTQGRVGQRLVGTEGPPEKAVLHVVVVDPAAPLTPADVVEAGQGWSMDPFAAEVRDGRIYGRGACDMKGGIAASVIALESILQAGIDFPGALEVSGTVDEESGGYAGVAHLAERGWFSRPRVDHVIIPEPLDVDRVCIGHRGVWWAEIETFGRIAHGSMPFLGDCAIRHMGAFLQQIEQRLLPELAQRQTTMPVVPPGARRSTLNINAIHGGQAEHTEGLPSPVVADRCRMVIDRRFLIEENPEAVKGEVTAILDELARDRPNFTYRIRDVMEVAPTMTSRDAPVVRALAAEIERVLQRQPELVVSPGTYDQKHIVRIGQLEDCVAYGPGMLELAHQPDEFVLIDDLVASAKIMAAAALRLLGVGP